MRQGPPGGRQLRFHDSLLPPHVPWTTQTLNRRFDRFWAGQRAKGPARASLFWACAQTVAPLFLAALPCKLLNDGSQFVGPAALTALLSLMAAQGQPGSESHPWRGCVTRHWAPLAAAAPHGWCMGPCGADLRHVRVLVR